MKQETNQIQAYPLQIVHAVPGRLRLRLLQEDSEEISTLELQSFLVETAEYLRQQEGVKSVKVKEITNSILVIFDPHTLSTAQLKECLSPFNLLSISPKSEADTSQDNSKKVFNQIISLIPILLSWFVVKRFNLSGWKAIVAYILATGLISEVIEQAQVELFPSLQNDNSSETKTQPQNLPNSAQEKELEYKIVHYIPGRIRLSMPKIGQDKNYGEKLQNLLEQDHRIKKVQINKNTGSVVINYLQEALGNLGEEELTLMLSNWMGLIDSIIGLETPEMLTAETETTVKPEEELSEQNFADLSQNQ